MADESARWWSFADDEVDGSSLDTEPEREDAAVKVKAEDGAEGSSM
jgi:hypothetical protein